MLAWPFLAFANIQVLIFFLCWGADILLLPGNVGTPLYICSKGCLKAQGNVGTQKYFLKAKHLAQLSSPIFQANG